MADSKFSFDSLKSSFLKNRAQLLGTFGLVIVFVPLMSKLKECYPFSHFPMYSRLEQIHTLKLTDQDGNKISTQKQFAGGPNSIRKLATARARQVQKERKRSLVADMTAEDWQEVTTRTLTWLLKNHPPREEATKKAKSFKLWRVEYSTENGLKVTKDVFLGEHPNTAAAATADAAPASKAPAAPSTPAPAAPQAGGTLPPAPQAPPQ